MPPSPQPTITVSTTPATAAAPAAPTALSQQITSAMVYERLHTVIDPELGIDIVKLGLIYNVTISDERIHILMTLTTPGCPLAAVFDGMVKDGLHGLPGLTSDQQIFVELTFDPPWVPDMMDEEAKAELGF